MQRVALGWGTWRNTWLQLAHAVALNGRSTVLCGPLVPEHLEGLPGRRLVGQGAGTIRLDFADEADLVARSVLVVGVLAALPLLVPARLRQHVTIVMGAAVAILTLRLWLVAPLPGLLLSAGGLAALVAAAQAVRSRAAAASR